MRCSKCWLAEKDHLECLDRDHAASIGLLKCRDIPCRAMRAVMLLAKIVALEDCPYPESTQLCGISGSWGRKQYKNGGAKKCPECWARRATR